MSVSVYLSVYLSAHQYYLCAYFVAYIYAFNPFSQVSFTCPTNHTFPDLNDTVIVTCEDDGQWTPLGTSFLVCRIREFLCGDEGGDDVVVEVTWCFGDSDGGYSDDSGGGKMKVMVVIVVMTLRGVLL